MTDAITLNGITFTGFNILKGTSHGDSIQGLNGVKEYDLGNGNNYLKNISGPADPTVTGPATNYVTINLGSGTSTIAGSVSQGSIINLSPGHTKDVINVSPNTEIVGSNATDTLTWGDRTLIGGLRIGNSDSPYATSLGGLFKYGINHQGDLVIYTPVSYAATLPGSTILDPATYVTGYVPPTNPDADNATDGIKVLQLTYDVSKFAGGGIGGLFNFDFSGVGLEAAIADLLEPAAAKLGDNSGARWEPPPPDSSSGGSSGGNSSGGNSGGSGAASSSSAPTTATQPGINPNGYLVVDLSGQGIATSAVQNDSATRFDINSDGFSAPSGWIGPDQAFLVTPDADGNVTSGNQFVTFADLAAADVNHTGTIDSNDTIWGSLEVWQDSNGNEQVDPGELMTLSQAGITSIALSPTTQTGVVQNGNDITASSTFTNAGGSSDVIAAVNFQVDEFNTTYTGSTSVSTLAATLPDLPGHGTLLSLQQTMSVGDTGAAPTALELAEQNALAAWPTVESLPNWVSTLTPVFVDWAAATTDPNPGAPGLWSEQTDSSGNVVLNAPTGEPDVYLVTTTDTSGTVVVDELVYEITEVSPEVFDPAGGSSSQTLEPVGHWVFASGQAVTNAQGTVIPYATLNQALASPLAAGENWTELSAGVLNFLSRYTGEEIPLGSISLGETITSANLTSVFNSLNTMLDLATIRFATQVPSLEPIFGSITYNVTTDQFTGNTPLGLEPMFQAIFADAPTTSADDAISYLQNWWPIMSDVINDFQRPDSALVTPSYVFSLIVAAWEATSMPLSLEQTAQALGMTTPITTGNGVVDGADGQADLFYAGAGNTTLVGGDSGNEFVLGGLYQNVEIDVDEGVLAEQTDTLRFATLKSIDVTAVRSGNDLLLVSNNGAQTVRIVNQFVWDHYGDRVLITGNFAPHYGVSDIVFADGVTWTPIDIGFAVALKNTTNQLIVGTSGHEVLYGGANDTLEGGGGADVYIFQLGDGHTTINENNPDFTTGKYDTLLFGAGITQSDLIFTRDPDNLGNLTISIAGTSDSLTIVGQFTLVRTGAVGNYTPSSIDAFVFSDGSTITADDLMPLVLSNEISSGQASVYGFSGDDTLDAGPGPRYVSGGDGNDLYIYNLGYGDQVFQQNLTNILSGGDDTVAFGAGISLSNITLSRPAGSNDLLITFSDGGTLTIEGQFQTTSILNLKLDQMNHFNFADGTSLSAEDLAQLMVDREEAVGNTTVDAFDFQETLNDPLGNVTLVSRAQGVTFDFGLGYGDDTISNNGFNEYILGTTSSTIQFGAGISLSNLVVSSPSGTANLIIGIAGTSDQLTILNGVHRPGYAPYQEINSFQFADGTSATLGQLEQLAINQQFAAGAGTIEGFGDAGNLFNSSPQTSYELSYGGADTFIFDPGNGELEINKDAQSGGTSTAILQFGSGVAASSLTISGDAQGNIYIKDGIAGDQIKLDNMMNYGFWGTTEYGVASIVFSDGTSLSYQQITSLATIGTSGADSLYGTRGGNLFDGKGAPAGRQDYEQGNGGSDTFVFDPGYGQLDINEDGGSNTVSTAALRFGTGITASMLAVTGDAQGDVFVRDGIAGDLIKIDGMLNISFWGATEFGVATFAFADGSTLNYQQIVGLSTTGTSGADSLYGNSLANVFDGKGAPAGTQDYEQGNGGADTFVYDAGYGHLEINENAGFAVDSTAILSFGSGIEAADLVGSQDINGDLILTDGITGDQITIDGMLSPGYNGAAQYGVEEAKFADGTFLSHQQLVNIINSAGNDGQIILCAGLGHVTLAANTPSLEVTLGVGIAQSSVIYQADAAGDLTLTLLGDPADSITLQNDLNGHWWGVSSQLGQFTLSDGTFIQIAQSGYGQGQGLNFTWFGTATNTSLVGSGFGSNTFDLGPDGDAVTFGDGSQGGSSQNILVFDRGDGAVTVNTNGASGTLELGSDIAASDVIFQTDVTGDLTIGLKDDPNDRVTIGGDLSSHWWGVASQLSQISFGDGTIMAVGQPNYGQGQSLNFTWVGTATNTTLLGSGYGSNTFDLGTGGDTVTFGAGTNIISFDKGDGAVTVNPNGTNGTLDMAADITASDVILQADATGDLTVALKDDPADRVTIDGDLSSRWWGIASQVSQINFGDGTTLAVGQPNYGQGQALDLTWVGTASNTTLIGSGFGSNNFDLGPGGDAVTFGGGTNVIFFDKGDGAVTVNPNGTMGTLSVGADIAASDVIFQADAAGDLTVALKDDPADSVTVQGDLSRGWWGGIISQLSQIDFATGSTLAVGQPNYSQGQNLAFTWVGTASKTNLIGSGFGSNTFDLGAGGDTVTFGNGNRGGSNQNTLVFDRGDGAVIAAANGGWGTLDLGADIAASDVILQADAAGDLTVALKDDTADSVTVQGDLSRGWWSGIISQLSQIDFGDGSTLAVGQPNYSQGQNLAFTWVGTASTTLLVGSGYGSNTFDLGAGGDTVTFGNGSQGGSNQNTLIFDKGDGGVIATANGGWGTLDLGADIAASDVILQADAAGDLTVALKDDTADSITVRGDLSRGWWSGIISQLSQIDFANGTTLAVGQPNYGQGQNITFTWLGTASTTVLAGSGFGSNIFDLGVGGDTVTAGAGVSNTYDFTAGDGAATINNAPASYGELDFGQGIEETNLWFTQNNNDLDIDVLGTSDQIVVQGWFGSNSHAALNEIVGGDGLKIDNHLNQLIAAMATFQGNNTGFNPVTATQMPSDAALQSALAASWH